MTLQQLRNQIDRLDGQLLRLINRRARLAMRVGLLKQQQRRPLFDPKRERAILHRLTTANGGPLPASSIDAIFREILRQARRLERAR
ncbi:MAG: chorismate mutase [Candidatus Omnitrophica bacterium]|nr:chorismate mutase [Candidatus Omnitrophota bacterium]